jgi:hypothetical protein
MFEKFVGKNMRGGASVKMFVRLPRAGNSLAGRNLDDMMVERMSSISKSAGIPNFAVTLRSSRVDRRATAGCGR